MELMCMETTLEPPTACFDASLLNDERVLHNLIDGEERYLISGSYFKCLQTDLKSNMRDVVANWMLEVCEEEQCQREVFPLAMNLLDRFLAVVKIRKTQLQLLGSVCLLIASKVRQSKPIEPQTLVQYTDWSITLEELTGWELLVLSKLKWDVAAVTANDFIGPLLHQLSKNTLVKEHQTRIKKHVLNMIDLCSADFNFAMYPASMIATASIITTIDGLLSLRRNEINSYQILRSISEEALEQLHKITGIDKELLRELQSQIEQKLGLKTTSVCVTYNGEEEEDGSPIDCPKENYNAVIINVADECPRQHQETTIHHHHHHPRAFKHTPCVSTEASIGVEF